MWNDVGAAFGKMISKLEGFDLIIEPEISADT
jgi:hypothetical protein